MAETFGDYLTTCLKAAGLTQLAFARKIGSGNGIVSRIQAGKRTPPLSAMDAWADALGLRGAKRERFIELAELAHAPERVARRYLAMQERLRLLDERLGK